LLLSERIVTEEERYFLNDLYQALGIPTEVAVKIVQVMSLKNLG
jgi:hypothetical protein